MRALGVGSGRFGDAAERGPGPSGADRLNFATTSHNMATTLAHVNV